MKTHKNFSRTFKLWAGTLIISILAAIGFALPTTSAQAQGLYTQPQINKEFSAISIKPGDITKLTVTIYNENTFALVDAAWVDSMPSAIKITNPANIVNTCGGSVIAVPGTSVFSLTGGTVAAKPDPSAPGECSVTIDVTSIMQGNHINTIFIGDLTATDEPTRLLDLSNEFEAKATLKVDTVAAPILGKSFNLSTVYTGEESRLEITIANMEPPGGVTLTETTLTDYLPTNVVLGTLRGDSLQNCGASAVLDRTPGNTYVTLSNASIAPQTTCRIRVNVYSNSQDIYINIIPAGPGGLGSIQTHQGVTNASPATAQLNVQAIGISKAFSYATVGAGDTSTVTITIYNPTNQDYTGITITDLLYDPLDARPHDLRVAAVPNASSTCGLGYTLTAVPGTDTVTFSGGSLAAALLPPTPRTCTIQFDVRVLPSAVGGVRRNTIDAGALTTTQGISNLLGTFADLTIRAALTLTKSFSPSSIPLGSSSLVTITLRNATALPITGVAFTDIMPGILRVAAIPGEITTCPAGAVTAVAGADRISFAGGTIPANPTPANPATFGTCTVTFWVTATAAGSYQNFIPAGDVTADLGISNLSNLSSNPTLTITPGAVPVTLTKSFNANIIAAGTNTSLIINIRAPADIGLTGFRFVDNLPAGVTITNVTSGGAADTPDKTGNCVGGTLTAVAGTSTITWEAGSIGAGLLCTIDVWVTSYTPGLVTNTIVPTDITNDQNRTISNNSTALLTVTSLVMRKAFFPQAVVPGGRSRLTITLTNVTPARLLNVDLIDDLATMGGTFPTIGVYIANPANIDTDCAPISQVSAIPGSRTLILTDGIMPAQVGIIPGTCFISVDVIGLGNAATRRNTILRTNVSADVEGGVSGIRPVADTFSDLIIGNLTMSVVKGFNPVLVYGGSASTMSIVLTNPNLNTALTGIAFTDTMPVGMILADPPMFNQGLCGGTLAGNPGDGSFSYSGGILLPGASCTLSLRVTMTITGTHINTLPAGAVTTFNGVSSPQDAAASLTNLAGASVSKGFSPITIYAGAWNYSLLTITIRNQSGVGLTDLGLVDDLPVDLAIAGGSAPSPTTNCSGGVLDAVIGIRHIHLTAASLANDAACTIVVPVTGNVPGIYTNTISEGTLTSFQNISNPQPATASLTVLALASLGDYVWIDTNADGIQDVGETGLDGVSVDLYRPGYGPDGIPGNADDSDIALTDITAASGFYLFENLIPGNYYVDFHPPAGYFFSPQDQGADDGADSDANTVTGQTITTTLVSGENDLTWDAGLIAEIYRLSVEKTGTLDMTVVSPLLVANIGDEITYAFSIRNTGNVTLTSIIVSDPLLGSLSCTIASLAPGATDSCTATGNVYALTQADIDHGSVDNTATATGKDPGNNDVSDSDDETVPLTQIPEITVTKSLISTTEVSAGTYRFTYTIDIQNTGNVSLTTIQVTDDLTLTFPLPNTFSVVSLVSPDASLTVNPLYNGDGNIFLLIGSDTLDVGETGTIRLVVQFIPIEAGPFTNTAVAQGVAPDNSTVTDQDQVSTTLTGPIFDPPFGIKVFDETGLPLLQWTMTWINSTNLVPIAASVSDPIPTGSTYSAAGASSGYPVPGSSPLGSTNLGITCTNSGVTTTTLCYYEGPTVIYPLGRILWSGTLGPDYGATDAATAANELLIEFNVLVDAGVTEVYNLATISSDLNGDGDATDPTEQNVASADASWNGTPTSLPGTGFAPNQVTSLPDQSVSYANLGDLWLEVPKLGVKMPIIGVPMNNGKWDVTWLGNNAGWLNGSAFPTWAGNSVITGHVWNAGNTGGPFLYINTLWYGDQVIIHAWGGIYIYEVREVLQVGPENVNAMMKHRDQPWVTLVTCRGFDEASETYKYRVLVRAVLVKQK